MRAGPDSLAPVGAVDFVRVFTRLLARHEVAVVAAIGDNGIITEMPPTVPLAGHRIAVGRSIIEMVVPADKVAVINSWEHSRRFGGATASVHMSTAPEQPVQLTFVDARQAHGVHLALMVPSEAEGVPFSISPATAAVPRTARIHKTDLAEITAIDDATTKILGWRPEQIVGRRSLDFIHPEDQERSISNWMEMLTAPGHQQRVRLRHLAADGSWVWMEIINLNLLGPSGKGHVLAEMLDISEELAAQEALRASEQRLRRLAESLPLGVVQIETDHSISYANERLASITGRPIASTVEDQFAHVVETDHPEFADAIASVLAGLDVHDLHVRIALDGDAPGAASDVRHCVLTMRSLTDSAGAVTGAIVSVSDESDRVRLTAELEIRATVDALTGCHNRQSSMLHLDRMLGELSTSAKGLAIVFVDLDRFKEVNDDLGHAAGDALLTEIGVRLREWARVGDIVGRVGGDEFLVICPDVDSLEQAQAVAARLESALARGVAIGDHRVVTHASLGVAYTRDPTMSSDQFVADADTSMYVEKRSRQPRGVVG